jgi:hypothetical protein
MLAWANAGIAQSKILTGASWVSGSFSSRCVRLSLQLPPRDAGRHLVVPDLRAATVRSTRTLPAIVMFALLVLFGRFSLRSDTTMSLAKRGGSS